MAEKEAKAEVITCTLCGEKIERPKGYRAGAFTREQQERVHSPCKDVYSQIMSRHPVGPVQNLMAIKGGLYELFPELQQTKAVKAYQAQVAACNAEIYTTFPFLKQQHDAAMKAATEQAAKAAKAAVKTKETTEVKAEAEESNPAFQGYDDLDEDDIKMIQEARADVKAGRVKSLKDVLGEETAEAIKKSDEDIKAGRVKEVTGVDDLLNELGEKPKSKPKRAPKKKKKDGN